MTAISKAGKTAEAHYRTRTAQMPDVVEKGLPQFAKG
jgi:hypothetical protein